MKLIPTLKQLRKSKKEIDELWPRHQALMPGYAQQLKLHIEQRLARLVTNKTLTTYEVEELQEKLGLFAVNLYYADNFNLGTDFKKVPKSLAAILLKQFEFNLPKFAHTLETGLTGELVVESSDLEVAQKVWDYGVKAGIILDEGEIISFRYPMYQDYLAAYYFQLHKLNKNFLFIAADWHWHYVWDILQGLEKDLVSQLLSFLHAEEKTSLDALYILAELRNAEAVESLMKIVENETGATLEMRKYAASALGQIGNEKSVEFLIQALKTETNPDLRWWMVEGLGSTDDLRAIPLLQSIAENDNSKTSWKEPLKKTAANAIRSIKSRQPG